MGPEVATRGLLLPVVGVSNGGVEDKVGLGVVEREEAIDKKTVRPNYRPGSWLLM
jgi:hypothetical protein